jgi:hypothetical protein
MMTPTMHLTPVEGGITFAPKAIHLSAGERVPLGRQCEEVGRLESADSGWFDAKVLSRKHAQVWVEEDGKVGGQAAARSSAFC